MSYPTKESLWYNYIVGYRTANQPSWYLAVTDEPELRPLSLTAQTAWQDLLSLLKDDAIASLQGTPARKTVGSKVFWYDRFRVGAQLVEKYIGEDTDDLRHRLARTAELKEKTKNRAAETSRLVRLLRLDGCLAPDLATGQLLFAMARVGVFRLGGTVVGTQAFRQYDAVLGVRFSQDMTAQTQDVDIASFERLSVVLADEVDRQLADVFADLKFEPVPTLHRNQVWRWRQTRQNTLVEFLTPSFEDEEGIRELPALGVSAQSLHFLNYLIAEPLAVPLLYRSGALIRVPQPERFAVHKLIVAERRLRGPDADKARKDRAQADFLIRILAEEQPDALADAYRDARERGPRWRAALDATLRRLPEAKRRLESLV